MNLDVALALFAAMPAADQDEVLGYAGLDRRTFLSMQSTCMCWRCRKHRDLFTLAVATKADEIERMMLAEQKTEGSA